MKQRITYAFKINPKDDLWVPFVKNGDLVTVTTSKGEWAAYYWLIKHHPAITNKYMLQHTLKAVPITRIKSERERCPECGREMSLKYCTHCEEINDNDL